MNVTEAEAKSLLASFGVEVPRGVVLDPGEPDVASVVSGLRPPYAVKALSRRPIHKTELDAVRLSVPDVEGVRATIAAFGASERLAEVPIAGYLVEEMAERGHELVVGGMIDPAFGPILLLGIGGVLVELLDDVVIRACPIAREDARAMLHELAAAPALLGYRGSAPVDEERVLDALCAIGGEGGFFLSHAEEIVEFDVNPLIATSSRVVAVDVRIVGRGNE